MAKIKNYHTCGKPDRFSVSVLSIRKWLKKMLSPDLWLIKQGGVSLHVFYICVFISCLCVTFTLLICVMFSCFFGQGTAHSRTHTEEDELNCELKTA